jgi:pseudaminic acid synthase
MTSDRAPIRFGTRLIGCGHPAFIVAELSANHRQSFDKAVELVQLAKQSGADAVKLQTYTADTITIRSNRDEFVIKGGTLWDGQTLHDLYEAAHTPWDWQPKLRAVAIEVGLEFFSSAFDSTAVDFLESINVAAHKIASPELVDIPLIRKMARTGKPLLMSTGMASLEEIDEAVAAARQEGATQLCLLKCTSAYPAPPEEANLRTIIDLTQRFGIHVGLSDHTMGLAVPVAAVALGACIIEKHLTDSRSNSGPDSAFSLEPHEFSQMVCAVRSAERALGRAHYGPTQLEINTLKFRRSLFVVADVDKGEIFTNANVRSIRPATGLHPRHLPDILGRAATRDILKGTPLAWDLVAQEANVLARAK